MKSSISFNSKPTAKGRFIQNTFAAGFGSNKRPASLISRKRAGLTRKGTSFVRAVN